MPVTFAQEPNETAEFEELSPEIQAQIEAAYVLEQSLDRKTGQIALGGGSKVDLNVPDDYYFLNAKDTQTVLEDLWGNPEDDTVLGMIFQNDASPLSDKSWSVVITYEDIGYVSDDDAREIEYNDLLKDMKKATRQANEWRVENGYGSLLLAGWATPPRYDAAQHKLVSAKDLIFENDEQHTLNYDMRVLGRHGTLSMNFVASMEDLAEIEAASDEVLAIPSFRPGATYDDFDASTDKVSGVGIAGLIAGGAGATILAKKAGFLSIALILLKKFGIFLLVGLGAAGRFILGLFGGRKNKG